MLSKWLLKKFIYTTLSLTLVSAAHAINPNTDEANKRWDQLNFTSYEELNLAREVHLRSQDIQNLRIGKWYLLNGQDKKALHYLRKIDTYQSELLPIILRYKAQIDFMNGRYSQALESLMDPVFNDARLLKQVCTLRILLLLIERPALPMPSDERNRDQMARDRRVLRDNFSYCRSLHGNESKTFSYWLNNLEKISTADLKVLREANLSDIRYILTQPEMVRVWLKTGLFTNNESLIEDNLAIIPEEFFRFEFFRELMALYYYRLGDYQKTLSFLDEIETPNADNIRGNINLRNQEYELAFGHFQLALQKKANSRNAMMRIIPLSWLLQQWDTAQELLSQMVNKEYNFYHKETLDSAIHIQLEELHIADRKLRFLHNHYQTETPHIINLMISYVSLRQNQRERLLNFAQQSCRNNDPLNCWILHQTLIWDNLSQTIERSDNPFEHFSIEDLKRSTEIIPLQDEPYINQADIEELDNQSIDLPFEVRLESTP